VNLDARPKAHRFSANGIEQACFEWNADARGNGPTLLLAHATGFHARCWDEVVRKLGDRHVIAVDMRGHGRSAHPLIEDWRDFGRDLAALVTKLELENILGVGHSMGGHAMVDAAALDRGRFSGLVLYDPVIADPNSYGENQMGHFARFADGGHPITKRKNAFESADAMFERFRDRLPYRRFVPQVLRDYCEYGLLPAAPGGGFVLACPPAVEASVYMTSRSNVGIFESARKIEVPVLVLRAKTASPEEKAFDFSFSPTWPGLVDAFPNARDLHFPEATHFMPYEDPAQIAERIRDHATLVG
jgi:pimeloyl-ACP methyl ester carboxylesterase